MKNGRYGIKAEKYESYGEYYISYAIVIEGEEGQIFICHDVTLKREEAEKLCLLLNTYDLEPEQAKYVVEDYIMERYLFER